MNLDLFKIIIQHVMLAGTVIFFLQGYYGFKSYSIHRLKEGLAHTFMCLCSGLYSLSYYLGTMDFFHDFGVEILSLTFIFAFAAFSFYLKVIDDFMLLNSKILKVTRIFLWAVVSINVIGLFSGIVFDNYIIFRPLLTDYKTAIGTIIDPKHTTSIIGRIVCGMGMLAVIVSSIYIFFKLREKKSNEIMLQWGVVLSLLTSINDIIMGMGIIYYLMPLSYFGNAFEVFRFGSYFQRKAFLKVEMLKNELVKVAQAAQVGYVAGSITHDIRNPLTVIMYGIQKVKKDILMLPGVTDKTVEAIDRVAKQAHNIKSIIEMYTGLMYVDDPNVNNQQVDLFDVVNESLELSEKHIKNSDIKVHPLIEKSTFVKGNKNVLVLSLTNLINNACQALDKSSIEDKWIRIVLQNNVLSIVDAGEGIRPEIAQKIFDMQFTTKKQGEGTGLGLGIVRELLAKYNMKIELDERDLNTKFDISLKS